MDDITNMTKEELLEMVKKQKEKDELKREKMRLYSAKYQQTASGREKYIKASKKYYDANREKILEKKRAYYKKKKEQQNK
tara:strand:+ start:6056 stop:6295 length:240 start_codon:yes stop_codon:yes gene_type:complete